MTNVARRWLPLALIAAATAASVALYDGLPPLLDLQLEGILPFELAEPAGPLTREAALFLMPALALVVWAAFRMAPTAAGQRVGRALLRSAPEAVTSPEQFERFGKTYDTIVLGVVLLLLGGHAAILSAALGYPAVAVRMIPMVLGASLIVMGNVMPRLRPNWVAGVRTRRTLENPRLWRASHRAFGAAFVVSGVLTMLVGAFVPRYGLATGLVAVLASCVVGFVASIRRPLDAPPVALVVAGLLCVSALGAGAQSSQAVAVVELTPPQGRALAQVPHDQFAQPVNHVLKAIASTELSDQMPTYRNPSLPLADSVVPAIAGWIEARFRRAQEGGRRWSGDIDALPRAPVSREGSRR